MDNPIGDTPAGTPKVVATPPAADTPPTTTTPPAAGAKVEQPVDVEQLKNELIKKDTIARTSQAAEAEAKRVARQEKTERIKLERQLKEIQRGNSVVPPIDNSGSSDSEQEIQLKVQLGIKDLIIENAQYRELVDNDSTLKEVIKNNPFVLIQDYFDANDALDQFKGKLDDLISKKSTQPKKPDDVSAPIIETKTIQPAAAPVAPAPEANQFPTNVDTVADSIKNKLKFN